MKRGEVWLVSFDTSIGGEIKKTRPAVIISNNASNKALNRVQIIPITSNTDRLYPSEAYIYIEKKKHKAMADQIATASKERLYKHIDFLSTKDMLAIESVLKLQLGL